MDKKKLAIEIKKVLKNATDAERAALDAIDAVREVDPDKARKLLEHPDYLKLLISRNRLETQLNELEGETDFT